MKGILFIRGGAIGDFICTLPAIATVRRQLPDTPLFLLSYDRVLPLARACGDFASTRSLESRAFAGFFARRGELDEQWKQYFASFGMILSFLYDPDGILQANLKRAGAKSVFSIDPRPIDRHATEHLCSILNSAGFFAKDFVPRIGLPAEHRSGELTGHIVVHPGSGSEKKNWDLGRWRAVLEHLLAGGLPLALIGGEADEERLAALIHGLPSTELKIVRNRPLLELASLLQGARLFIGQDSGITHLAAALGVPTLALFGPSHPHLWAPRGPGSRILWKNKVWDAATSSPLQLGEISVDENSLELVKAEVERMLDQNPEPRTQDSE